MILINSHTNDPFFNIATEEFLLKKSSEDILFFYINSPSVIIGKHQIHNAEINIPFITKKEIPVIRRISGGGSVFHDLGNLNYAIISSPEKAWVDFENFTTPLICLLSKMGLSPELRSKSDIRITKKKISGNASHIFKNRVLHHGSILFNTDLSLLTDCLKNSPSKYICSSVQSRRSIVTNISSHLKTPMQILDFKEAFIKMLKKSKMIEGKKRLETIEKTAIQKLIEEKYRTTEWDILYNANYQFSNIFSHKGKLQKINLKIKKGICEIAPQNNSFLNDIQKLTNNVPHETSVFSKVLKDFFTEEEIINYFF